MSLVIGAVLSMIAMGANADSYSKGDSYYNFGYSNVSLEFESPLSGKTVDASGMNFIVAGFGYKLADNVAIEVNAMYPLTDKKYETLSDTYKSASSTDAGIVFDSLQTADYESTIKAYFVSVDLKLDFPVSKNFDAFINMGYAYGNLKHTSFYNDVGYAFTDHEAADAPDLDYASGVTDMCYLTGVESLCGTAIASYSESESDFGAVFGAGVRFYFSDDSTFTMSYNKYKMDFFEADSINARVEFLF